MRLRPRSMRFATMSSTSFVDTSLPMSPSTITRHCGRSSGPWTPGVMPDHTEHLREQIAAHSLPRQGSARLPDACPECGGDLRGDEDEDEDDVWFCYHCGRDLSADVIRIEPQPKDDV